MAFKIAQQLASDKSDESKELVDVAIAHPENERKAFLEAHGERFRASINFALDEEFTVITQRRVLQSVNKINHLTQHSNVVYQLYWSVSSIIANTYNHSFSNEWVHHRVEAAIAALQTKACGEGAMIKGKEDIQLHFKAILVMSLVFYDRGIDYINIIFEVRQLLAKIIPEYITKSDKQIYKMLKADKKHQTTSFASSAPIITLRNVANHIIPKPAPDQIHIFESILKLEALLNNKNTEKASNL